MEAFVAANNRSKYGSKTRQSRKQKGKTYKINGARYRLVPRSDGRYNIVQEGRQGVAGSTPIITAKNYQQALNVMRKTVEEIDRENAESSEVGQASNVVSAEEYDEATAEPTTEEASTDVTPTVNPESNSETSEDSETLPEEEKPGRIRRTVGMAGVKAGRLRDSALDKQETLGTKLMKSSLKNLNKELSTIARAGGGPNALDKAVSFGVGAASTAMTKDLRETAQDFAATDRMVRTGRHNVAVKANKEAIANAKKEGYEKLEIERQELNQRYEAATTPEEKAKVAMELKDWKEKKASYDKYVPENVKLPFPHVPDHMAKVRTAKQRRRYDKSMNGWILEENLEAAGRKKAAKIIKKQTKANAKVEKLIDRNKELQSA
jgi:hypothetical protein